MSARAFPVMRLVLWACTVGSAVTLGVGGFALGLHVPLLLLASVLLVPRRKTTRRSQAIAMGLLGAVLVGHFLVSLVSTPCETLLVKSLFSLCLMLLTLLALFRLAQEARPVPLATDMKAIVALVTVSLLIDVIWSGMAGESGLFRASGIYLEPSHLALSMSPIIVALGSSQLRRDRFWSWGAFASMALLSASATLFVMVGLCTAAALVANSRRAWSAALIARLLLAASGMAVLVALSPYADEFAARVMDIMQIDNEANLSSVVYVSGWESAVQNLRATQGFGLGFNRMGCDPRPETEAGAVLEFLQVGDLNFNDGSFTMAKVLSELGLVGAVLWLIMLTLLLRMMRRPPHQLLRSSPLSLALAVSAVTIITLGALVRGTNYFSGPFLLGLYFVLSTLSRRTDAQSTLRPQSTEIT